MATLNPHNSFGGHVRDAAAWFGITVAFFTVLLTLMAILLL